MYGRGNIADSAIISAIVSAALRGVEVDIVLPKHSNLPYMQWAAFGKSGRYSITGAGFGSFPGHSTIPN